VDVHRSSHCIIGRVEAWAYWTNAELAIISGYPGCFFEEYQEYRPSKPFQISISHAVRQLESFKNFKNAVENVTFLVRRRASFQHLLPGAHLPSAVTSPLPKFSKVNELQGTLGHSPQ